MVNFYKMDFIKGIVILVKLDVMCNIWKSLLVTAYWFRDDGGVGW